MRLNVSRQNIDTEELLQKNVSAHLVSLGASYTHVTSLKGIVGRNTQRVVMYHARLTSLAGFEDAQFVEFAFLGFNRIDRFLPQDASFGVLDLAGNPLTSLRNCPRCETLIVSSTRIENLLGCPDGVKILRCGHSCFLRSLRGCPSSVKIIECACAPNLIIQQECLPLGLQELHADPQARL